MLTSSFRLLATAAAALVLAACSTAGSEGPPPKGGPPPGTPPGQLVSEGTSFIHTFDLTSGSEWSKRLSYSGPWSAVTVVPSKRELLIAKTSGSEPVIVEVYDIGTFGLKESFEWPDSTSILSVYSVAATQDGKHLAIVMTVATDLFLEVIERETGRIVYSGMNVVTDATMTWTPDDSLLVAVDLSHLDNHATWGAIATLPLADLEASTDGNLDDVSVVALFSRAEWDFAGVDGLALSPDGTDLAYARGSDLWVVDLDGEDLAPHQLTTGPSSNRGPVFSPDGKHIAFASGSSYGLDETYVIPNHRNAPLFIDHSQGAGDQYLLEDNTLVDNMLAWLP